MNEKGKGPIVHVLRLNLKKNYWRKNVILIIVIKNYFLKIKK